MKTGEKEKETVLDQEALEKSLDTSMAGLKAELGITPVEPVKPEPLKKGKTEEENGEPEDTEGESEKEKDGEEEGYEETAKSIEAMMNDAPEAEAAMDVEPFLRTLVKSIDKRFNDLASQMTDEVGKKLDGVVSLVKSQATMMLAQADLQKSISENTRKIGDQTIPSASVRGKAGERFAKSNDGKTPEIDFSNIDPAKIDTLEWLKKGWINNTQATVIDNRVTKNALFKSGDATDLMVKSLIEKQEAK
jgi:hypothetical protein